VRRLARRHIVVGGAALAVSAPFAACVPFARATENPPRIVLAGSMKQGSLVVARARGARRVHVDGTAVSVSPEGMFAFGFAFDQTKPSHLSVGYADGSSDDSDVTPEIRQYEVQSITGLPPSLVTPSPEDQARIQREHALVAEARKTDSDAIWFSEPFDWPANGIISGLFGSQRILNGVPGAPHFGVDIAAAVGAPIRAPVNGTVLIAQEFFLEGGYTMLDHGHGVFTGYMHQSRLLVKQGDRVERGQQIGLVGKTGRATGPHVHWSLNWFQVRLDPSLSARLPAPAPANP